MNCIRAEGSSEQTGTDPESAYRVKKPSIAVVAGASTSEDVCPWESAPEPRSRKNSIQMDSGSSSSDVSVAVAEVSDRLRRTCGLMQQNTLDGGQASRKLSTASFMEPRRASVCVPISISDNSKRSVSSFEDSNVSDIIASPAPVNPSDRDNKNEEFDSSKTFGKGYSLTKTCSVTGANAPIISVSSVMDDALENPPSELFEEKIIEAGSSQPLAPLAEPDSESPASELPPEPSPEPEAKSNDVCPWEDE